MPEPEQILTDKEKKLKQGFDVTVDSSVEKTESSSLEPKDSNDKGIELRSDEVQEILSFIPSWMVRWGISLIFIFICILIFLSWLIKYPDIIPAEITLTTTSPPVKLVANQSGKITHIFKKDGNDLMENESIAQIESPVSRDGVFFLKEYLKSSREIISNPKTSLPLFDSSYVFGSMQTVFHQLQKENQDYQQFALNPYRRQMLSKIEEKVKNYRNLVEITGNQIKIAELELKNAKDKYEADKLLFKEGVLAKMPFYNEESAYHQKLRELGNLKINEAQTSITLIDLEKELLDLTFNYSEQERNHKENIALLIQGIENEIENWQQNYLIKAPLEGKLIWLQQLNQNQFIDAGTPLFAIVPEGDAFVGFMKITPLGFGKLKIGQKVRIKLHNYPFHEFGVLEGEISNITEIPNENNYWAECILLNGFQTTFNRQIKFTHEMAGIAEIVTDDLRVAERIFFQFRKIFERDFSDGVVR